MHVFTELTEVGLMVIMLLSVLLPILVMVMCVDCKHTKIPLLIGSILLGSIVLLHLIEPQIYSREWQFFDRNLIRLWGFTQLILFVTSILISSKFIRRHQAT